MTEPQPFAMQERVRWADVDLVGIMRFSAFTRLVELAEQELFRDAGLPYHGSFDAPTIWMPRRHLSIEYFAPARIDEALTLVTYLTRIGDTSMTINVDVRTSEGWRLVASAAMVVVCVTVEHFAKRALPVEMRSALAPYACSMEAARSWRPNGA